MKFWVGVGPGAGFELNEAGAAAARRLVRCSRSGLRYGNSRAGPSTSMSALAFIVTVENDWIQIFAAGARPAGARRVRRVAAVDAPAALI